MTFQWRFEGLVNPSQPSDIKNNLYWQTQYIMWSKVTKLALYSVFTPININFCASQQTYEQWSSKSVV